MLIKIHSILPHRQFKWVPQYIVENGILTDMEATTSFFESFLSIKPPWHITRVTHDNANNRVDLYVEHGKGIRFPCPKCNEFCSIYDHQRIQERAVERGRLRKGMCRRPRAALRPKHPFIC